MAEEKNENENMYAIDIQSEYESYDPSEYESKLEKRCIYRWPNDLVITSSLSKHRTPHMVSLGPFHHRKEHLQPMEHHKVRALFRILKKSNVSTSDFIKSLKDVEQELRDSYDNLDQKMTSDSFLRMMLLDGCFMLELFRTRLQGEPEYPDDPVFNLRGVVMDTVINRDMMILENQIPLLVLRKLQGIVEKKEINDDTYLKNLFGRIYGFSDTSPVNKPNLHILDVYRKCLIKECAPTKQTTPTTQVPSNPVSTQGPSRLHGASEKVKSMLTSIPILDFRALCCRPITKSNVRSAMRFHEAGVEFRKRDPYNGLRVTFDKENGVLTLPVILVHNHTAAIYVNIMAFERMHSKLWTDQKMISFVGFMDSLVDTAEDVNLLCSRGIMTNLLGSDEEAAEVFNNLLIGIPHCPDYEVYDPLQKYVASYWNAARAYLKRKYFKNPWAAVSLLAAIFCWF
ncbi:putative UPF0481 protein At3g02645 [Nymphaea colorata]|uniref:Uncharacterized protein n=1 Tax=Nymphaea colorata TaxID=210225 RepID=A0A5K1F7F4_9MAGN|nr:putative UPF0481 protein At3g02645 [Nymphaea colorata]VVW60042.1 unnamed protein product [Nymphaea colorata]